MAAGACEQEGAAKKEKFPPSMDGRGKISQQGLKEQGMIQRR